MSAMRPKPPQFLQRAVDSPMATVQDSLCFKRARNSALVIGGWRFWNLGNNYGFFCASNGNVLVCICGEFNW